MSASTPGPRCWSRPDASSPWSESTLTFGDASLLVRPTDDRDDVWVTYAEVTGVEELGEPGAYGHVVEVARAEGPLLQLALPDDVLEQFLGGLRGSVEHHGGPVGAADGPPQADAVASEPLADEPSRRTSARPSRTRMVVLLAVLVALVLALVALILLRPAEEEAASPEVGTGVLGTDTTEPAPLPGSGPATTPSTTEPADPDDPASAVAIEVASVRVGPPDDPPTVYISTIVENLTDVAVVSYRVNFAVVVDVEPERPVAAVFSLDCADAALEPGETREAAFRVDDAAANAAGLGECTIAGWPVDADDPEQAAVHAALSDGVAADVGIEVTRVALEGDTLLEERDDA